MGVRPDGKAKGPREGALHARLVDDNRGRYLCVQCAPRREIGVTVEKLLSVGGSECHPAIYHSLVLTWAADLTFYTAAHHLEAYFI